MDWCHETVGYMFNLGFGDFVKENIYLFIYLFGWVSLAITSQAQSLRGAGLVAPWRQVGS